MHERTVWWAAAALLLLLLHGTNAAGSLQPTQPTAGNSKSTQKQQGLDVLFQAAALNIANNIQQQVNPILSLMDQIRQQQSANQHPLQLSLAAPATAQTASGSRQGSRQMLASSTTTDGRTSNSSTTGAVTTASSSTLSTADRTFNAKTIQAFVNLIMSDSWMMIYSGFSVLSICIKFLILILTSFASGELVVDSGLVLDLADLAAGLGAEVSWLVNSATQTGADATFPLELIKPDPAS